MVHVQVEVAPLARMTATVEGKVGPRDASLGLRWSTLHHTLTNEQPQLKWCQQLFSSFVSVRFAVLCVAANTNANCQLEVGN